MSSNPKGTAVITGASSGIGAVYADRLAKRGYDVILVARDAARLEALAARLHASYDVKAEVLRADLTDRADVAGVEARFVADPAITLLVNTAGISMRGTLIDSEPAEVEQLIALNITAPTRLAGAAVKAFITRKTGSIVNIASVLALAPEVYDGVYSGSKAYLLALSQSLTTEIGGRGVYVQAVLPGATRTELWERAGKDIEGFPPEKVMLVDDLVDAALIGFDRGETVTIPPLADEGLWTAANDARLAMGPVLTQRDVAPRYRETVDA